MRNDELYEKQVRWMMFVLAILQTIVWVCVIAAAVIVVWKVLG